MTFTPARTGGLAFLLAVTVSSAAAVFEPRVTATEEAAVVHLYRPAAQQPGLAKPLRRAYPEVMLDDVSVGTLPYNHHLSFHVPPGEHTVRVTGLTKGAKKWDLRDVAQKITAEAGQTLFLRLKVEFNTQEMNIGQPKPSYRYWLGPVDPEDAQYEIRDTRAVR